MKIALWATISISAEKARRYCALTHQKKLSKTARRSKLDFSFVQPAVFQTQKESFCLVNSTLTVFFLLTGLDCP